MIFLAASLWVALENWPLLSSKEVCQRLSQLGTSVTVSQQLEQVRLVVSNQGASEKTLVHALATALQASVVERDGQLLITRTKADEQTAFNHLVEQRIGWIQHQIDQVKAYRGSRETVSTAQFQRLLDQKQQELTQLQLGHVSSLSNIFPSMILPSESLLLNYIERMGLREFATGLTGQTSIYRFPALTGFKPLPDPEQLGGLKKLTGTAKLSADAIHEINALGLDFCLPELNGSQSIAVTRLIVSTNPNGILFALEGYDQSGKQAYSNYLNVNHPNGLRLPSAIRKELELNRQQPRTVELEPECEASLRFLESPEGKPIPQWITNPEKVDPLSTYVRQAFQNLAIPDAHQKCSVAVVCDAELPNVEQSCFGNQIDLNVLSEVIKVWTPYETVDSDEFRVLRPIDASAELTSFESRRQLADAWREVTAKGWVDLWDLCNLHAGKMSDPVSRLGFRSPTIGNFEKLTRTTHVADYYVSSIGLNLYKLLGTIPSEQFSALLAGHRLSASQCFPPGLWSEFIKTDPATIKRKEISDLLSLPSEAGLNPSNVWVSIRIQNQTVFKAIQSKFPAYWSPIASLPQKAGSVKVKRQKDGSYAPVISEEEYSARNRPVKFLLGIQPTYFVKIEFPDGPYIEEHFMPHTNPMSEPQDYAALPKDLRHQVWQQALQEAVRLAEYVSQHRKDPIPIDPTVIKP